MATTSCWSVFESWADSNSDIQHGGQCFGTSEQGDSCQVMVAHAAKHCFVSTKLTWTQNGIFRMLGRRLESRKETVLYEH